MKALGVARSLEFPCHPGDGEIRKISDKMHPGIPTARSVWTQVCSPDTAHLYNWFVGLVGTWGRFFFFVDFIGIPRAAWWVRTDHHMSLLEGTENRIIVGIVK